MPHLPPGAATTVAAQLLLHTTRGLTCKHYLSVVNFLTLLPCLSCCPGIPQLRLVASAAQQSCLVCRHRLCSCPILCTMFQPPAYPSICQSLLLDVTPRLLYTHPVSGFFLTRPQIRLRCCTQPNGHLYGKSPRFSLQLGARADSISWPCYRVEEAVAVLKGMKILTASSTGHCAARRSWSAALQASLKRFTFAGRRCRLLGRCHDIAFPPPATSVRPCLAFETASHIALLL